MIEILGGGSAHSILFVEPDHRGYSDEHGRLHNWLMHELSPSRCEALRRAVIRPAAVATVEALRKGRRAELFEDVASVVPVRVFAKVLGLPSDANWLEGILAMDSASNVRSHDPAPADPLELEAALKASHALYEALAPAVMAMRESRDDVLLSALWRDADSLFDRGWGPRDIIGNARLLLRAGSGTTVSGTCNAFYLLLTQPGLQARLRSAPDRISVFVEEALRYFPPVTFTLRAAEEPTSLEGVSIKEGEVTMVVNSAANRDPGHYPRPHDFDMNRQRSRDHFTFQRGARGCVGQFFARTEIEEIVRATLALGPMELAAGAPVPEWGGRRGGVGHGRWRPLHVTW